MTPPIYCHSFQNPARRDRLQRRFDQVGLACTFSQDQLTSMDVRRMVAQKTTEAPDGFEDRTVAVMLSHLRLIRQFVDDTTASHGIFCEDDIYLRKSIAADLPAIVTEFDAQGLDVLLLGYLWPWKDPDERSIGATTPYQFFEYDSDLWGAQMYMLSRRHARHLIETYTLDYALAHWADVPFSPDWVLTKVGRRRRISPMLAVEEGEVQTTNLGQIDFHRRCADAQYDSSLYV